MKTLQLLRHAKTERGYLGQNDFDRELMERGYNQIDDLCVQRHYSLSKAQFSLVSSARRTRATFDKLNLSLDTTKINFDDLLYLASLNTLIEVIQKQNESINNLLIIGHNEGLSDLASYVVDDLFDLPTCGYLVLDLHIGDWCQISRGVATLKDQYYSNC